MMTDKRPIKMSDHKSHKELKKKKGQADYLISNSFRIAFMVVALIAFFLMINFYVSTKIDVQNLQAQALLNRILYSDAVMYSNPQTARVYVGIVDMAKFNDASLDASISYGNFTRHVSAKLKLLKKLPEIPGGDLFIADAYLNRHEFEIQKPRLSPSGKGAATMYITKYPVTYLKDGIYDYGTLVVEIIIPNS